jgi:eukaryotic-like serine/threonine-protein kinase
MVFSERHQLGWDAPALARAPFPRDRMTTAHALIGQTLAGRFRITKLIGEGAMATVLRGEQDTEPREVAIKIMRPELGIDPSFPKRFRREAKTASVLEHPNTVRILDFGADGDTLYIVMELLRGRDLFDTLQTEKRLSEARAARLLIQVCKALSAAHGQGIIHRDLKPENVWLEPDPQNPANERVKVLDFGIAKLLDPDIADKAPSDGSAPPSSHLVTMAGTVVGTPEYMSPEQCKGEQVGPRSDVYSCGVILYQLVTGRAPFVAHSAIEVTIKHVQEAPEAPSKLRPGLNPVLEAIILSALAKSPEERTKSAAALAEALEAVLPKLSNEVGPAAPPKAAVVTKTVVSPVALQTEPVKPKPLDRTLASEIAPDEHAARMAQLQVRAAAQAPPNVPAPPAALAPAEHDRARAALRTARATQRTRVGWFVAIAVVVMVAAAVFALTR